MRRCVEELRLKMKQRAERRQQRKLAKNSSAGAGTADSAAPYSVADRPTASSQRSDDGSDKKTTQGIVDNATNGLTTNTQKNQSVTDAKVAADEGTNTTTTTSSSSSTAALKELQLLQKQTTNSSNKNCKSHRNLMRELMKCCSDIPSPAPRESPLVALQPTDFENEHTIHQVENFASALQQQQLQQEVLQNDTNSKCDVDTTISSSSDELNKSAVTSMDVDHEDGKPEQCQLNETLQQQQRQQDTCKLSQDGQQQQEQQNQQQQKKPEDSEQKDASKIVPLNSGTVVA